MNNPRSSTQTLSRLEDPNSQARRPENSQYAYEDDKVHGALYFLMKPFSLLRMS